MSGGSWEYLYERISDAGARLANDRDPLRRAMAPRVQLLAVALRAIEWNDSGDGDDEESAKIRAFLSPGDELTSVRDELRTLIEHATSLMTPKEPA